MTKTKTVAKVDDKTNLPATYDYGEDAGKGVGDLSQAEKGLPFLKILQAQSPEVIGPQGKIDGACAGLFLDTGTEQLYEEIKLVPACRVHMIQEWRPRKAGGGLVNQTIIPPMADYPDFYKEVMARTKADGRKFGDFWTGEPKKSNQLKECFQLFCVVLNDKDTPVGMVVVPFSSTGIRVYKSRFSRRVGRVPGLPPFFSYSIILTTEQETNDEGTWFNYVITFPVENNPLKSHISPESDAYKAGRDLYDLVESGAVVADISQAERVNSEGGGETSAF